MMLKRQPAARRRFRRSRQCRRAPPALAQFAGGDAESPGSVAVALCGAYHER